MLAMLAKTVTCLTVPLSKIFARGRRFVLQCGAAWSIDRAGQYVGSIVGPRVVFSFASIIALAFASEVRATTINFEGLADSTIVTTQYSGLTFSNTIVLTAGISLNEYEFPPNSGENVASDEGGPITIEFSTPITTFGGYFTYLEPLTVDGFNESNTEVASATSEFSNNLACLAGPPCSGDPGSSPNEYIEISSVRGISSVTIAGDPLGGSFTMDDIGYVATSAVPEPGSIFYLMGAGLSALWFRQCLMSTKSGLKRGSSSSLMKKKAAALII